MEVFAGNCCILYIRRLKELSRALILVAKSARGDGETALAPLLGFLIGFVIADLCREKAAGEKPGPRCRRYRAFNCDPPPRGGVFTAALSGEGDLPLDPSVLPPDTSPPPTDTTHLLPHCSFTPLPSGVILSHHRAVPPTPHPFFFSSAHPFAGWPSGESLILSALQISTLSSSVGCQRLFSASLSGHHHPPSPIGRLKVTYTCINKILHTFSTPNSLDF
ncbi:unnamed protein product [Pleuronectes platessa]|uniref:Uncharacterized protein n=1 Tax=Pleuronectes platessa TaxID=8262 RepID=A0A9N7TVV1_PLEPL|nr:unnamed protein product [Pleuronectes platessa]